MMSDSQLSVMLPQLSTLHSHPYLLEQQIPCPKEKHMWCYAEGASGKLQSATRMFQESTCRSLFSQYVFTSSHIQEVAPHCYHSWVDQEWQTMSHACFSTRCCSKWDCINQTILTDSTTSTTAEKIPQGDCPVPCGVEVGRGLQGIHRLRERTQCLPLTKVFTVQHVHCVQWSTVESSSNYQPSVVANGWAVATCYGEILVNRRPVFPFLIPLANCCTHPGRDWSHQWAGVSPEWRPLQTVHGWIEKIHPTGTASGQTRGSCSHHLLCPLLPHREASWGRWHNELRGDHG